MRRDSIIIVAVSAVITVAIVSVGYYLDQARKSVPSMAKGETGWTNLKPHQGRPIGNAKTVPDVPAGTSPHRTDTPIKCHNPEAGDFWTNAASCDDADLDNHLSHAAPHSPPYQQLAYATQYFE